MNARNGALVELRDRIARAIEQLNKLNTAIAQAGDLPKDIDVGVGLAVAAHHIEAAQQLLRLLEQLRGRSTS